MTLPDVRARDGDSIHILGCRVARRVGFVQLPNLRQVVVSHGRCAPREAALEAAGCSRLTIVSYAMPTRRDSLLGTRQKKFAVDTSADYAEVMWRDWGRSKMLEFLGYAAFLVAVFGCLYYIMNSLETEGPPEGPKQ